MLGVLAGTPYQAPSARLINTIAQLAQDPHEKSELRRTLLNLICAKPGAEAVMEIAAAIYELDPKARDNANVRATILAAMRGPADNSIICRLARALSSMMPPPGDFHQARHLLLARMTAESVVAALCANWLAACEDWIPPLRTNTRPGTYCLRG